MTHFEATTTAAAIRSITAITMLYQLLIYQNYYYWPHRHSHLKNHCHTSVTIIGMTITANILSSLSSSSVIVAETKLDLALNITLFCVRLFNYVHNASCIL